jgi:hypothetical protein
MAVGTLSLLLSQVGLYRKRATLDAITSDYQFYKIHTQ